MNGRADAIAIALEMEPPCSSASMAVAYLAMMYHIPPSILAGLAGIDLAAQNIPTETEYVEAYCRQTGRDSIPHYQFYIAFNFFRLAAIFHGIKGRVIRGTASSAQAAERAAAFPELARIAWRCVSRATLIPF